MGGRWDDWGLVFASAVGTPLDAPNVTHRLQRIISELSDRRIEEGYRAIAGIAAEAPLSDAQAKELSAIRADPRHPIHIAHGLPHQRFHDLRHLCATLLISQGVSPRVVMERLGHSQISLTMNTYAHLSPPLEREAARALDAVLAAGS